MRKYTLLKRSLAVLSILMLLAAGSVFALPTGDMAIVVFAENFETYLGVAPGDTIRFNVFYFWMGDAAAPDVRISFQKPEGIDITAESVNPSSKTSSEITWDLGAVENFGSSTITMLGIVRSDVVLGTELKCTASISGGVKDTDLTNNSAEFSVKTAPKRPDLFVWKMGTMEIQYDDSGFFFTSEEGAPAEFTLFYANMGTGAAHALLVDELPEGFEFASAEPAPSRVSGNRVEWDIGALSFWTSGEVRLRAIPRQSGLFTNRAVISTTAEEAGFDGSEELQNTSELMVKVVPLLPPTVTQPATSNYSWDEFVMTPNPRIEGLAKAGATILMYEGPEYVYGDDVSGLTLLGSTTAGVNRTWTMQPQNIDENKDYHLYFRAVLDGKESALSQPLHVSINTALAEAGFDMDGYSIETGDNETNPGGLGGSTGSIPGEDVIITLRQTAPNGIDADTTMWAFHRLNITVEDDGQTIETTVPVDHITHVGKDVRYCYDSWDFVYVIGGYGAGAKITVSFKPVEYDCSTQNPEYVIGDDIKITEILIDPAGYVYDVETAGREYTWPEVPPENSLIDQAMVTAYVRDGEDSWSTWDAAKYDQVNPQKTDTATEDKVKEKGYYAFFVPSGQYRVMAEAPEYVGYESPILTVVNEPIYHNVGMRRAKKSETSVRGVENTLQMPRPVIAVRNFPNPFNMSTNIFFVLPASGITTVSIFNTNGQKVRDLSSRYLTAGAHTMAWDGRDDSGRTVSSGMYFSVLRSGKIFGSSRMMLLK